MGPREGGRQKYDGQSGRMTVKEKGSEGTRERGGKGEETGMEKGFRVTGYQRKTETGGERQRMVVMKSTSRDFLPKALWQVC